MFQPLDEIKSASDMELIRIYKATLLRNREGRLDNRLRRIIDEIKRRNAELFEIRDKRNLQ